MDETPTPKAGKNQKGQKAIPQIHFGGAFFYPFGAWLTFGVFICPNTFIHPID